MCVYVCAVTLTADGCVNNIKFASYLTGNRPLKYEKRKEFQIYLKNREYLE